MLSEKKIILFQFLGSNKQFFDQSGDDNRNQFFRFLIDDFLKKGFISEPLYKQDLNEVKAIIFFDMHSVYPMYGNIFQKIRFFVFNLLRKDTSSRNIFNEEKKLNKKIHKFLIAFEPSIVCKDNFNPLNASLFNRTFSWSENCCGGKSKNTIIKLPIPNLKFKELSSSKFLQKKVLVSISSNKGSYEKGSLCEFKYKAYDNLFKQLGNQFDLYGYMWEQSFISWFLKFIRGTKSKYFLKLPPYYKGSVKSKNEILSNYKFCLTIENMSDSSFITEKIFNAIYAGCVPIYFGAINVSQDIPPECFINLREFDNWSQLCNFLINFSVDDYEKFLISRDKFLKSNKYKSFTSKSFSRILTSTISKEILFE